MSGGIRFTERFTDIAGQRVFVVEMGRGPTVVLLPSMLTYAWSYRATIRLLARRFRVIAVEAPGSGRSSRLNGRWSFEDYGRWVGDFLEAQNLNDVTLIGHSNSGAAAIAAAGLRPERISRLILADPTGADAGRPLGEILIGRAIDGLLEPLLSVSGWHHVVLNAIRHPATVLRQIQSAQVESLLPLAKAVQAPTLIAWGRLDHTMRPRGAHRLRRAIAGSTLVWLDSGSHDWIVDRAAKFVTYVEAFWRVTRTDASTRGALRSN